MSQPPDTSTREGARTEATITVAKLALIGTIIAAIIGATATITAAVLQSTNASPTPQTSESRTAGAKPPASSTPAATTPAATSTAPAGPDGVTYQCTGSAPAGIEIIYGPSGSNLQATSLPFTASTGVNGSVRYYHLRAQLKGSGHVTCTLTVTAAGRTATSSGTANGGYNSASPQICSDREGGWRPCG